jgi:hypothetical protein
MENDDQRRRRSNDDRLRRHSHDGERGRNGEPWREDDDRSPHRDEQRYGRGYSERSNFSPDWSRDDAEPRRSDDPYYSRNREREPSGSRNYSSGGRPGDYNSPEWPYERGGTRCDVQRSDEDQSHYRGYYRREATPFAYPGGTGMLYSESLTLHGPYTGRGPKGYKRSDEQLIEEASQRLERDGDIDATEIEVTAEDGVLVLRGTVADRQTKRRAEECVESVYGARDVMNELRVSPPRGHEAQGSQESQGSQASQRGQSARSSSSSQGSASPASRVGSGSTGSEHSEDKRSPKH